MLISMTQPSQSTDSLSVFLKRISPGFSNICHIISFYNDCFLDIFVIIRFDMSCAQAHLVESKPIRRVVQLKLLKPTLAIGYSLSMCTRHADSTNPGSSNLVFRSKPIPEAEMSNRLIIGHL